MEDYYQLGKNVITKKDFLYVDYLYGNGWQIHRYMVDFSMDPDPCMFCKVILCREVKMAGKNLRLCDLRFMRHDSRIYISHVIKPSLFLINILNRELNDWKKSTRDINS